jgi:hypothetical protein
MTWSSFWNACSGFLDLEAGTYDTPINWDAGFQTLVHRLKNQLVMEAPEDHFWELEDYSAQFGDPATNGKGHTLTEIEGFDGNMIKAVLVPGPRVHKLKRRRVAVGLLSMGAGSQVGSWMSPEDRF